MIAPALQEIADELGGRLTVAKMNVDENPQTPVKYGVRGIPMLMLFKNGQVAGTKIGAMPKQQLTQWVESLL
jgi:thioredoxin 1